MSGMLNASDADSALESLHQMGCTDGLPVVIPTAERVQRMVLASGLDPDIEIGEMGPGFGVATIEKVCVAAVMAGCLPEHVPVVIAAVKAICQPEFDLTEMQVTTHCIAPMIIVNGPARVACGDFSAGFGLMGPGHRANASVGRALRLAMINIGGATPGISDMAIHGSPSKFSLCFAEDEESSPYDPLHTTLGYDVDQSVVTILGVEGPHSVLFSGDVGDDASAESLLNAIAAVIANRGSNNSYLGGTAAVAVILNPEHAEVLNSTGWTRDRIQETLAERAVTPRSELEALNAKMLSGKDELIPAIRNPKNIHVLVAGGPGLYTVVMPSWCAGPHGNIAVHAEIELDQYCEIPDRT
ncbi:MAG: hypothetical protein AAF384_14635 [Pseudomonadota bacterium]